MKQLTILVDMDDTIEDLLGAWLTYLNEKYGLNVQKDDITQWDISKAFPMLDKNQVYEPLLKDEFWETVKPINGAPEVLKNMIDDGHKIYIVTASTYHTLPAKMESVLFKYFPYFTWNDVIVTSNKQMIKGDVLIDDGIHNHIGGEYLSILMSAPHNLDLNEGEGIIRVHNWKEIYEVINEIAKKGR